MADFKKLGWMRDRLKTTQRVTTEDIDPASGWTNDPQSRFHQLLINLPGFKKNDIKLQVEDSGNLAISGGRQAAENRRVRFQKTFKAPEDSDTKNISMQFVGYTLQVNIPKVAKTRKEEPEIENGVRNSPLGEQKKEELPSSKEVKDENEEKRADVVSSSDLKEDQREDSAIKSDVKSSDLRNESSEEAKEKEETETKNGVPSSDLRDEKSEEFERSEEAKGTEEEPEIKNGTQGGDAREEKREEFESSEEKKMNEKPDKNGAMSNEIREESERSMDGKEGKEKPEIKEVLSEKRDKHEHEISEVTKDNQEEPEVKDKREGSEGGTVPKEEPEREDKASSSELTAEEKRDNSGDAREENAEKPEEHGKEQETSCSVKGKDDSSHGKTPTEKSVMDKIMERRGILLATIISFTLGVLVSQKFHKPPTK